MTDVRAGGSRVRTVFLGSGGFGVEPLRALAAHTDIDLVGVVTAPGGGTPIAEAAGFLRLEPILAPRRLRAADSIASILALEPGLIVLADYGQIVPADLLALPHGALNLHPSLLPRHRGATPIPAAILAGDAETGVSLMRMDAGLDTGPLVGQRRLPLSGDEVAPDLEVALSAEGADLLGVSLAPWLRGESISTPQGEAGATMTRPLRRADGRLDPARSVVDLERQVRAYQPWPGSFIDTKDGRIVVWDATAESGSTGPSGIIVPAGLSTSDGILVLHEVQPAGGKRMPWAAFLRGRPGIVGSSALASDA
ncbi:MAG: methionyl-tRNA formyltransferase [Chloroflexota bacterium]